MIKSYKYFLLEQREQRDASLFSKDERNLIDDLFLEYVDKYGMIEMPIVDGLQGFDMEDMRLQYFVERYRNIAVEIVCSCDSDELDNMNYLYQDLEEHFLPRLRKYGYHIIFFEPLNDLGREIISIVITKDF